MIKKILKKAWALLNKPIHILPEKVEKTRNNDRLIYNIPSHMSVLYEAMLGDGEIQHFEDGSFTATTFYENYKKKASAHFNKHGQLHDTFYDFHGWGEEGTGAIRLQIPYVNGVRHGITYEYKKDGTPLLVMPMKNGKKHGIIEISYPHVYMTYSRVEYKDGELNGTSFRFHENGVQISKDKYIDGKKIG